ncbi:MAG: hypothetical protein K9K75_05835 [Deltaproteobacteria bacterium]|nr:hypothetical protein [Deltaproteobacteria bacterium]
MATLMANQQGQEWQRHFLRNLLSAPKGGVLPSYLQCLLTCCNDLFFQIFSCKEAVPLAYALAIAVQ